MSAVERWLAEPHGTEPMYRRGCRCRLCLLASAARRRLRRTRARWARPTFSPGVDEAGDDA
jgi:hypothetical protein